MIRALLLSAVVAGTLALAAAPAQAQVSGGIQLGPVTIGVGTYDAGYYGYSWPFNQGAYYAPGWYGRHYWEGGNWRGRDYYRQNGMGYRYRSAHRYDGDGNRGYSNNGNRGYYNNGNHGQWNNGNHGHGNNGNHGKWKKGDHGNNGHRDGHRDGHHHGHHHDD